MEKFMQKENVCLRLGNSDDMDFNDVFGGPPKRFSMQEVRARYSFAETEEEIGSSKPVFGEEIRSRRRPQGDDFFDDIFKGGETPRRSDSTFGSNPGSRIMSPSWPLPPKSDPFATSLPTQFSLPAKLTKPMELPTFGSHKMESSTNGLNSPHSSSPLSRFSNQGPDEAQSVPRQSPLSLISDDSPSSTVISERNVGSEFHFSIYKWAGKGVPMLMPLVIGNNLKSKFGKSGSSNGRMESKSFEPLRTEDLKRNKSFYEFSELKPEKDSVVSEDQVIKTVEKQVPVTKKESEMKKPLHAFLHQPGDTYVKSETKNGERVGGDAHEKKNMKEKQGKSSLKGVDKNIRAGSGSNVKEFVEIFNQDGVARSGSYRRRNNEQRENEVSSKAAKDDGDKKQDVSFKVDDAQLHSTPSERCSTKIFLSSETLHTDSKISVESSDDPLEDNFQVEELGDDHENVTESGSSECEGTKAIDAKIRQWSLGKKGNIRSLLSTLQYVLWAESGWKPVPLVDLIESNSVKRAYQKALLRLHPDKLQQKGAAFNHKYIAEKVFDILQEAWDHFNTCSLTIS